MEVPDFKTTKGKLMEDGMSEEDIEDKLDELREQYEGLVSKKEVLAHILAKERGVVKTDRGKRRSKGTPKELTIEELEPDMDNIMVKGYAVGRRFTETENGDEMSWVTLVDKTGTTSATIFGEGSIEWDWEFGQPIAVEGQTFEAGGDICPSSWNTPRVLDEEEMGYSLEEVIKQDISDLEDIHERKFVAVDGLCTDFYKNTYEGCQNCRKKIENCDCDGNFGTTEYSFKNMKLLTSDGEYSVRASADPSTDIDEDVKLEYVRVMGEYTDGTEDEDHEPIIRISKVEKLTGDDKPDTAQGSTSSQTDSQGSQEEKSEEKDIDLPDIAKDTISAGMMGEENVSKILGFVDRYGEVPRKMFDKFVEGQTSIEPPESAFEQMKDDGILYLNDDDKIERTKEE